MTLFEKFLPIILALETDPLMSLKTLAEETKLSWPTAKKRYEQSMEMGLIGKSIAHYDYSKIGLKRISLMIDVPNHDSLLLIADACREHPYTIYRRDYVGQKFGTFINFNIPEESIAYSHLVEYFNTLQSNGHIQNYEIYTSSGYNQNILSDLDRYDIENRQWKFSWDNWMSRFEVYDEELPELKVEELDFEELTENRLKTLNFLTKNAAIKQSELMDKLDVSRTEAHRLYSFVMDNLIPENQIELIFKRDNFNMSDLYLYHIPNVSYKNRARFYNGLQANPPPFRFAMDIMTDSSILFWGNMDSRNANMLAYELWKNFPSTTMYTMANIDKSIDRDRDRSSRFMFYPDNFDTTAKKWRTSYEYMVENPLRKLNL